MKNKKITHILLVGTGLLLLLTLMVALGIPEKYSNWRIEQQTKKVFIEEYENLNMPLTTLGFTDAQLEDAKTQCGYQPVIEEYYCSVSLDSYMVFDTDQQISNTTAIAAELDKTLEANGWTQRIETDFWVGKWFDDVLSGVDYYPDSVASKKVGDLNCTLSFYVAYSKKNTPDVDPAVRAVYQCMQWPFEV